MWSKVASLTKVKFYWATLPKIVYKNFKIKKTFAKLRMKKKVMNLSPDLCKNKAILPANMLVWSYSV